MSIPVANLAALPADRFEPLRATLAGHTSMSRVLAWLFAQTPPPKPDDLVAQDEFSYDLLVPQPGGLYLSYDTS